MNIAIVSDMLNLHQSYLCDAFLHICDKQFTFIEVCKPIEGNHIKMSSSVNLYDKSYYLPAWKNEQMRKKAMDVICSVDALIICGGDMFIPYERERLRQGKLTFEYSERQLKRGIINAFSKTSLSLYKLYMQVGHKNLYKLCSSAYTANDMYFLHPFFRDRCYKWGYFTHVPIFDVDDVIQRRRTHEKIKILSVARLISWKRIDLLVSLADMLNQRGADFEINIIGTGPLLNELTQMSTKKGVSDKVNFLGLMDNNLVHEYMRDADIFIFPSNKREGWGAVLNEAMSNGCACIASDLIGAAPFLIDQGKNGFMFKTNSIDDLVNKVVELMEQDDLRELISKNAYETMLKYWNPQIAAQNFCTLVKALKDGECNPIINGPCSKAEPIIGKTFTI